MIIGLVNERSTASRNPVLREALERLGHTVVNAGMTGDQDPPLNFVQAGVVGAALLNFGMADFVVGGCGNGQGFMDVVMQFPGVLCGLVRNELDGWLFAQINGGNCVSLVLGQEYGFGSDVKLGFLLERLFSVEIGSGYPKERREPQQALHGTILGISKAAHVDMAEALMRMDREFVRETANYPAFRALWENSAMPETLKNYLRSL